MAYKSFALFMLAALAEHALANIRRAPPRRDYVVEWVTTYQTVTYDPLHDSNVVPSVKQPSVSPSNAPLKVAHGVPHKRGLAYNTATSANFFKSACPGCAWAYNWDSAPGALDRTLQFVPMLWSDAPSHTERWDDNVRTAIASGSKALLSFNEPDNLGQANMSPQTAAAEHRKHMNKFSSQALIGSPSITNSGSPDQGLEWLKQFFIACNGRCHVDFCNVHWYSDVDSAETLFDHLEAAHRVCGDRPLWLTEFALDPAPANGRVDAFLRDALPRLDNLAYLDAYAFFMVSTNKLLSSPESLSSYGKIYATL